MTPKLLLPVFFIFSSFLLQGQQQLDFFKPLTYPIKKNSSEKIHDIHWMPDGNIAIVGEVTQPNTGQDGLIMIIDAQNGNILKRQVFKGFGEDVLKSVVWGDYSLFAVGHTDDGTQKKKNGWLLELDWSDNDLKIMKDTTFGTNANDEFSKVIWTNESGAMIAGISEKYQGSIWLLNWNGVQKMYEGTAGTGMCRDLIGMKAAADGSIWLCGNAQKSKSANFGEGDIWWIQIDESGKEIDLDGIGTDGWKEVQHVNSTLKGNLLIGGTQWKKADYSNIWAYELDGNKHENGELAFDTGSDDEKATTIFKSPQGNYWLTTQTIPNGFGMIKPINYLAYWNDLSDQEPYFQKELHLKKNTRFQAIKIIRNPDDTYILAGNLLSGRKHDKSKIHLFWWKKDDLMLPKGEKRIQHSSLKIVDRNVDGIISPNEPGAIKFRLKNIGDTDLMDGRIEVETIASVTGLTIKMKRQILSYLHKGGEKFYKISLQGNRNLSSGEAKLKVKIKFDNQEVHQFIAKVKCGLPQKSPVIVQNKTSLDWRQPDVRITGDRNVSVLDNNYEIQVNVNSDRLIKREDFKVRNNGKVLMDNKKENGLLTEPIQTGKILKYTFAYKIENLKVGENVIEVAIGEGEKTIPITINYQPQQPNLHVLAIGPTYSDLKFSSKDARDFANAIRSQAGRGFFNQVFIDTLVTPDATEQTKIKIAVKKLAKRTENQDLENHIKSNDYVMVFFSGHGIKRVGKFKLLPTDYDPDFAEDTALDYKDDFLTPLSGIGSKVIVFIDACLSGGAKSAPSNKDLSRALLEANQSVPGLITLSSCSEHELSYEDPEWQNGAFTKALVEAINGKTIQLKSGNFISADNGLKDENGWLDQSNNGIIVIGELMDFLKLRVEDLVKHRKGKNQTPSVPMEKLDRKLHLFTLK